MPKIRVYTIHPGGKRKFAPCTEKDPQAVVEWLENADTPETFTIVVGEMEELEYEKMPEYLGP